MLPCGINRGTSSAVYLGRIANPPFTACTPLTTPGFTSSGSRPLTTRRKMATSPIDATWHRLLTLD